jgi:predicted dehydrogenase
MSLEARPSRRKFLQSSAAASLMTLGPAAYARVAGANERLGVGMIGLGVMGGDHLTGLLRAGKALNLEVVRTCDVYRRRAERAAARAGKRATATQDYQEVLGDKNVHAVFVATPDHWHGKMAIDAIGAGKHVYLEKPMCHTIEQALELARVEAAAKARVRVQVGVQSTSSELNARVREVVARRGLGRLVMALASVCRNNLAGQWRDYGEWENLADPRKAGIDWDRWLGHRYRCAGQELAPRRPWDPRRFFQFRCYWDYSGGVATDLFFHRLTPLLQMTGLGYPERVTAAGGVWVFGRGHRIPASRGGGPDDREVPDMYTTTLDYPGGPTVTLLGSMANDTNTPMLIAGHDATLRFSDSQPPTEAVIEPQTATGRVKERIVLKGAPGEQVLHRENFIQAIRDPKRELSCPVSLALRANIALALGVKAYRERRVYGWDPVDNRPVS